MPRFKQLLFFIASNMLTAVFTYIFDKYLSRNPSGDYIFLLVGISIIIFSIAFAVALIADLMHRGALSYILIAVIIVIGVILTLAIHHTYIYLALIHLLSIGLAWCFIFYKKYNMSKNGEEL